MATCHQICIRKFAARTTTPLNWVLGGKLTDVPDIQEVALGELPESVLAPIVNDIAKYSVLIYALDPSSHSDPNLRQLGSGTLVECCGMRGILTAHHVVHRTSPAVDWSLNSNDEILLTLDTSGATLRIPAHCLHETVIAIPISDAHGPDLTFLEIPKGEKLSELLARKSFWKIDFQSEERIASCLNEFGIFVTIGQPNELECLTRIDAKTIRLDVILRGYAGPVRSDRVFERGEYDFVDTVVRYDGKDTMPKSFGGISGGGLWKVDLEYSKQDGKWVHTRPVLCGLAFYETERDGSGRVLRCHFVKSIYGKTKDSLKGAASVPT